MKRQIRQSEKWFVCGLVLMLLFVLTHDWIPLGTLNDLNGIRLAKTTGELIQTTVLNVLSFLIVLTITLMYIGKRYPIWAKLWLVIHLFCILYGALSAWWIPYFFGPTQEHAQEFEVMFGNTHAFLPKMNGMVPNTIHTIFHLTLLFTWILSIYIVTTNGKDTKKTK